MRSASRRRGLARLAAILLCFAGVAGVAGASPAAPPRDAASLRATFARDVSELVSWRSARILAVGAALSAASAHENPDAQAGWLDAPTVDGGVDLGNTYGDAGLLAAGSAALMAAGALRDAPEIFDLGFDASRALLYSGAMTWALKASVRRTRPNGGAYSFPSGHTAAAFSIAPVLARRYGWRVGVPALALASATGMGRMEDRYHYLSDVMFGAAIGLAAGEAVAASRGGGGLFEHLSLGPDGVAWSTRF